MDSKTAIAAAPIEIELKFAIDPADIAAFRRLPFLRDVPATETALSATYFDTEDHALYHAGYTLRLRRSAKGVTQTLKGPSTGGAGLFARSEAEHLVEGDALDAALLAGDLPEELRLATSGRLAPIFTIETERTEWLLRSGASLISLCADSGAIEAAGQRQAVAEIELEVKEGPVEAAVALAQTAAAQVALHLEPLTKSDRGYRLIGVERLRRSRGALPPAQSFTATLRRIAASLLNDIALQRPVVAASGEVEAVHHMRVLLRRLRCLLDIVRETMDVPGIATAMRTLRRAFRRLGAVREIDILTAALPLNSEAADPALARLAEARMIAMARAARTLASRRFGRAQLRLLAFATATDDAAERPGRIQKELGRVLRRRWRALREAGAPGPQSPAARHRLRIKAKTLRYASDFAEDLYPSEKALKQRKRLQSSVRTLQETLGQLNDERTLAGIAVDLLGKPAAVSLGLAEGGPVDPATLAAADRAYQALVRAKPYWR